MGAAISLNLLFGNTGYFVQISGGRNAGLSIRAVYFHIN